MKKTLIIFALLVMVTGSWAQSNRAEETSIKNLIEKESHAAVKRNYGQWIECFAQSPDVAFGFHPVIPNYMVRSFDKLSEFARDFFPNNPVSSPGVDEFMDYKFRINGTSAFVTSIQINTQPDGSKVRYHKADYLEKINGEWKMIGHFFAQEPDLNTDQQLSDLLDSQLNLK